METNEFIQQLNDFAAKYKIWWCEPFEQFSKKYKEEHPSRTTKMDEVRNFHKEVEEFRNGLQKQYDLPEDIFRFLDENYGVYLTATQEQQIAIRNAIKNATYVDQRGSVSHFIEDLLTEYADRARKKLRETSDSVWIQRGLVAISLEDCGTDYRDTITQLAYLYIAAQEMGIEPEAEFQAIAKISSHEKPRGGSESMSQMMASTHNSAYYRERTKSFSKR